MAEKNQENNEQKNVIPPDDYERELTTDLDDDTPDKPKGMRLHTKIVIGLLVGVIGGLVVNWTIGGENPNVVWAVENFTRPIGQLFLNLLLMIVVPLVFASLVVGVAGIGDIRKLGRIGAKSFGYTLVISAISVVIGLGLANIIRPGERIDPVVKDNLKEKFSVGADQKVASAINVGAVGEKFCQKLRKYGGEDQASCRQTDEIGQEAANQFANNVDEFSQTATVFAEASKNLLNHRAISEKADEITKEADTMAERPDLLARSRENFRAAPKDFSNVKKARSAVESPL